MISIIVPTYNEKENILGLLERISKLFSNATAYEIIVIDDNSIDGTWELLQAERAKSKYPVKPFKKEGQKGKAYSLIEGFAKAAGELLVMIDADLQYPPEAIPRMLDLAKNYDIVVANQI